MMLDRLRRDKQLAPDIAVRHAQQLNDAFTTRACRAAVRSAEAMLAEFSARRG
jgi:hypothetical protein